MGQESELSRLEQFVEKLLSQFSALRQEKKELEQELTTKNQLIEQLQSTLSSSDTRQIEVGQRLGSLVARIEQWEQDLVEPEELQKETEAKEPVVEQSEGAVVDEFSSAPTGEEAADVIDSGEKDSAQDNAAGEDGRVQHNLFSLGGSRG